MDTPLTPDQLEAIRNEVLAGHKIQAIKLYREATGKGLAESKQDIETFETQWRTGMPAATPLPGPDAGPTPEQLEAIRQAMIAGNKIQAIKLYRDATRVGLAEAKQAVEDLDSQWRAGAATPPSTPVRSATPSKTPDTPFARPAKVGCFGLVAVCAGGLFALAHWIIFR